MKLAIIPLICALLLVTAAEQAHAIVNSVTPVPVEKNVRFGGGSTFTVTWRLLRGAGAPFTITSPVGEFRRDQNSNVAWATTRTISRRFTQSQTTLTITETVAVPQSVLRRALETNGGRFIYFRRFADDGVSFDDNSIQLNVAGGTGGEVNLSQATLTFGNGSSFATVAQGAALTAKARVTYAGTGRFSAVWEVGESTGGRSFFRPISTVNRTLSGQREFTLESPALPTLNTGRYEVRLRVTEPGNAFDNPTLSYFVTGGDTQGLGDLPAIGLTAPKSDAAVGKDDVFQWQEVKGASAYRLQVLENTAAQNIVAQQIVQGSSSKLSTFVRAQLQAPAAYLWRVVAVDGQGRVIAASNPRQMRVKP